jgi:hypothetical protein
MTISANYPTPVIVNGYQCWNCAQVAEAKQDINPADPKAGPWGVDGANGTQKAGGTESAVTFGGGLSGASVQAGAASQPSTLQGPGALLDIQA